MVDVVCEHGDEWALSLAPRVNASAQSPRLTPTFVSRVSEAVCAMRAVCVCTCVCGGGMSWSWAMTWSWSICIQHIDIVHNQFGSANQRYCALPHHSSTRVDPRSGFWGRRRVGLYLSLPRSVLDALLCGFSGSPPACRISREQRSPYIGSNFFLSISLRTPDHPRVTGCVSSGRDRGAFSFCV